MKPRDSETVRSSDDIWNETFLNMQRSQVRQMRDALMECNTSDAFSVKSTMQNILVMRIYHQISRIIRYTEEMDKIELALYKQIDGILEEADYTMDMSERVQMLQLLIGLQTNLQKNMIDSQKLLDPYLNINDLVYVQVPTVEESSNVIEGEVLDQNSRKMLREGAQAALEAIKEMDTEEDRELLNV